MPVHAPTDGIAISSFDLVLKSSSRTKGSVIMMLDLRNNCCFDAGDNETSEHVIRNSKLSVRLKIIDVGGKILETYDENLHQFSRLIEDVEGVTFNENFLTKI